MTKVTYTFDATLRVDQGKGASRRLRRTEDRVPAILYGGQETPSAISLDHKKVMHALENPKVFTHLLTLNIDGKSQQVILKDIQRHHYKKGLLHIDFLRVKPTDILVMRVPFHFVGAEIAPGVKDAGGIVNHQMNDIEVRCEAQNIPESIEIDLSKMELDQTLHISHIKFPKGVESLALSHGAEHDHPVVSIHLPRALVEEEPVATEAETTDAAATDKTAAAPAGKAAAAPAKAADKGKAKK